jgi:hypothetical protein
MQRTALECHISQIDASNHATVAELDAISYCSGVRLYCMGIRAYCMSIRVNCMGVRVCVSAGTEDESGKADI